MPGHGGHLWAVRLLPFVAAAAWGVVQGSDPGVISVFGVGATFVYPLLSGEGT